MVDLNGFTLRFWGVRGSIACPGEAHRRYGGNTSCIEVRCGEKLLILDAGTGLRPLGENLNGQNLDADILLTHAHHDHIAGLPFFLPFFASKNCFRIWAGHLYPDHCLHDVLCQFMAAPIFPVPPKIFSARMIYKDFTAGETLTFGESVTVKTAPLNHPNGATGYRIEFNEKSICYVTDTEHLPGRPDQKILDLISGADLLIYDCSYTDEEFPRFVNWGHSTWQEGLRLCDAAGVGKLIIFHHDPSHDDEEMDRIAEQAEKARSGTLVAQEGLSLDLRSDV
ncbi:MAG: MBL fold metallo-hydrolase [Kiloniellales bacterium]|nr:MBL fold metallo-hydrolase [Kiloniellales bacterium]